MGSEVRPPLTVEETGPHFNHCHISDIWKNMSGSGDRLGLVGLKAKVFHAHIVDPHSPTKETFRKT